jgi:hypothetical protein
MVLVCIECGEEEPQQRVLQRRQRPSRVERTIGSLDANLQAEIWPIYSANRVDSSSINLWNCCRRDSRHGDMVD